MPRSVILASQSRQRKMILQTLEIPFKVIPSRIDEGFFSKNCATLSQKAKKLAFHKCKTVSDQYPDSIVIAADTFADLDGNALEKPKSIDHAKKMLQYLSGRCLKGYTGFCYRDASKKIVINRVAQFTFCFRELTIEYIDQYVSYNPVTEWSAAFSPAYPSGASLITQVKGSLTAFTYGLPIEWVVEGLKRSNHILSIER